MKLTLSAKKIAVLVFSVIFSGFVFAQTLTENANAGMNASADRIRTSDEGMAAQEFRRGVQSYYRGAYNEAVLQFEKALSYLPNDNLILDWLGKANYKSGLEGLSLSYWNNALENGYGGLLLANKIEIVQNRRATDVSADAKLSEAGSFSGNYEGNFIFAGPTAILPNSDGTYWVVSTGSNELFLINQNGFISSRVTGPVNGFDRPFDLLRLSGGKILVSESLGDRLALLDKNGHFEKYIGERGRGNGQFVGPQYLATDSNENIFVTDYGNRRVVVFDFEGNALFTFGKKEGAFKGLKGPTGIAIYNDVIYVADDQTGNIVEFDKSGNYIRDLVKQNTFKKPEGLKIWNDALVLCDSNKIFRIDMETGSLSEIAGTGNAPSRCTQAVPDLNGNLVVCDYKASEIYIMSEISELVGGMFVQVESVNADNFPQVTLELRVENRRRNPVVGLLEENFFVTENKNPVSNLKFIGAASNNDYADITFVIDRNVDCELYGEQIDLAVREICSSMANGTVRIVSAGNVPVTEYSGSAQNNSNFTEKALKTKYSTYVPLDLAMRLSANDLINSAKKRSIIYITNGTVTPGAFEHYSLSETAAYLNNNSIGLSVVQLSQKAVDNELNYLIENTQGELYYVYRPQGLSSVIMDIIDNPSGIYQLTYTSNLKTNFGEAYLPVEAEVYLLNRSGRDESGYFAPLE